MNETRVGSKWTYWYRKAAVQSIPETDCELVLIHLFHLFFDLLIV